MLLTECETCDVLDIHGIESTSPKSVTVRGRMPTIGSVGRILIYKDMVDLMRALRHVKEVTLSVLCLVHSEASDVDHAKQCIHDVKALGAEDDFVFEGRGYEPQTAIEGSYEGVIAK